jgi:hypothetical protein
LIELPFPELAVELDPLCRVLQRLRDEPTAADASFASDDGEPGALEHAQMLGRSWQRHRVRARELADRRVAARESREHAAPRWIRERVKRQVEGFF